ncbi:MAG: hypothetical protein E7021_03810 [Alphaproteobacteria bacterium]|nr:hypothetical protein [Alphaproteobacteria bacterium]
MHYNQNRTTYERIRKLPALTLINMSWDELKKIEKDIKQELNRVTMALKWIQGIQRVKQSKEVDNDC